MKSLINKLDKITWCTLINKAQNKTHRFKIKYYRATGIGNTNF